MRLVGCGILQPRTLIPTHHDPRRVESRIAVKSSINIPFQDLRHRTETAGDCAGAGIDETAELQELRHRTETAGDCAGAGIDETAELQELRHRTKTAGETRIFSIHTHRPGAQDLQHPTKTAGATRVFSLSIHRPDRTRFNTARKPPDAESRLRRYLLNTRWTGCDRRLDRIDVRS